MSKKRIDSRWLRLVCATISALVFPFVHNFLPSVAHNAVSKTKQAAPAAVCTSATGNFRRFLKTDDGWTILNDPSIKRRIHRLMGKKDDQFWDCAQLSEKPTVKGKDVLVVAGVRGIYVYTQSIIVVNSETAKCIAAYLRDSELHIFGVASKKELPALLNDHIAELRRMDNQMKVVFDKADWSPDKPSKLATKGKNVNMATIAGTYTRADDSRFAGGTIQVREMPDGTVKFDVQANNGGNSGGAQGSIAVKNHRAVFAGDSGKIELEFKPGSIIITGDDSPYCGMGVTLLGEYFKTDDVEPKLSF